MAPRNPHLGTLFTLGLTALAVLGWAPGISRARESPGRAASEESAVATPRDLATIFESGRLLDGAARLTALETVDGAAESMLRGARDPHERTVAAFLCGAVRDELGRSLEAAEAYRRAQTSGEKGPFADDAAFAAIQSLEAAGRDGEAAREWVRWEQRYPRSPLVGEAHLARARNALRRGEVAEAKKLLAALATTAPWSAADPRVALTRATSLYMEGHAAEAQDALGPAPQGAGATYLRALCLGATGSLLKSAAAFQEVAERYPRSPLHDHALFAKANTFLVAGDYRSAASEFARVVARVDDPAVKAEIELRCAGAVFLSGQSDSALTMLRDVVGRHAGTDVAARAQFLVGEVLVAQGQPAAAIVELNRVLTSYYQHSVAASAQYRVARCLDALDRRADATGTYQAVVSGFPLEPEAPAAAYLAGVGLMTQGKPLAAAPYFQLVLDRYARGSNASGQLVFASPEHQEIVEAALCLLELAYHRTGNLGQLSGAPHVLLQRMPPSRSTWRAYALLIDADAAAAQARYPEAQATLESLTRNFADHPVGAAATKLLAWSYARQGRDSLAIAAEERLVVRYASSGDTEILSAALLDIAHERFNQKRYKEAAGAYEEFLRRFPLHPRRLIALYQAGLCYLRLNRAGDAVDRWEAMVRDSAGAPVAERAWSRAGDVYFQAERYEDAKRCYAGLLDHFAASPAASLATLRLAQCEYNAGRDAAALGLFANTMERFPGTPAAREAARGTELALYRLAQSPKGDQELARLVEQFPTSPFAADAQFQIARRLYQQHRWLDASEGFRRVVSQFPAYSAADQAQLLLADALVQAHQTEEARSAYEQFLSFFPSSPLRPTVQFRSGLLSFEAKEYLRAATAFTQALADSAPAEVSGAARYNLALCERQLGQPDEALAELERYRTSFPADARAAEVAYQLGDLHDAAERTREAAHEFERALASRPSASLTVELQFRLGRCRERLNDPDGALKAYQQAGLSSNRDHPFRLSAVARCAALYESRHDYPRALAAYRDIVRNAKDGELVAAATGRVSQLEATLRKP